MKPETYDIYSLTVILSKINRVYGDEIELHTVLQKNIDALFASTYRYF
jgi:hypothetical protein